MSGAGRHHGPAPLGVFAAALICQPGRLQILNVIAIGPKSQEILAPYFDRPAEAYLFSPRESEFERHRGMRERRTSKVQPSQQNRAKKNSKLAPREHYDRDSYRRAVQRAARKAGVESWNPHQLRHANATEVRKQFGIEAAQVMLGHNRISCKLLAMGLPDT